MDPPTDPASPSDDVLDYAPAPEAHDPYAALRQPNYRRYFIGNAAALVGMQMAGVTVGWELYARTHSAVALGMVGLVQVVPIVALALPAGHMVDRFNRKSLIILANAVLALSFLAMGLSSLLADQVLPAGTEGLLGWLNHGLAHLSTWLGDRDVHFADAHVPILFALLLLNGIARSVNQPAKGSLLPMLVQPHHLPNAVTWSSSLFETSNVVGPMIAGFAIAAIAGRSTAEHPSGTWAYAALYWTNAACQILQIFTLVRIKLVQVIHPRQPVTLRTLLAGVRFVWHSKIILGAITLDMFAVLLGGATALLPLFAQDILQVGPVGLGWLRAAPSIGALTMAMCLAHLPPMKRAGRNLLWAVTGFGVATIVFGLSRNFWLSMAALILTGAFDNISVVVRHSLVQLLTPDEMRGRVNAVNGVFISTSNELGAFESGATAAIGIRFWGQVWGPMIAVAAGGVGTIIVVVATALALPQVGAVKRLAAQDGDVEGPNTRTAESEKQAAGRDDSPT